MTVYSDDAGRQAMARWYEHFLGELRHPVSFVTVSTRWGETNVLCTGPEDGPPLFCLHGVMGSAPSALSQCQSLADTFRIVFPDTVGQPGRSAETYLPIRGRAYGQWATEVLDGLGLDRVRVLGASMGGFIALDLARQVPERIEALALWVPGGIANPSLLASLGMGMQSLACYLFPNPQRIRALYDQVFTDYDDAWFGVFSDGFTHVRVDRRMPQPCRLGDFDALSAPVLLVVHELDTMFPPAILLPRAQALFPTVISEVVPGMKHSPAIHGPESEAVVQRISAFLLHPTAHDAGDVPPGAGG